jgi:hypothetical protein
MRPVETTAALVLGGQIDRPHGVTPSTDCRVNQPLPSRNLFEENFIGGSKARIPPFNDRAPVWHRASFTRQASCSGM